MSPCITMFSAGFKCRLVWTSLHFILHFMRVPLSARSFLPQFPSRSPLQSPSFTANSSKSWVLTLGSEESERLHLGFATWLWYGNTSTSLSLFALISFWFLSCRWLLSLFSSRISLLKLWIVASLSLIGACFLFIFVIFISQSRWIKGAIIWGITRNLPLNFCYNLFILFFSFCSRYQILVAVVCFFLASCIIANESYKLVL